MQFISDAFLELPGWILHAGCEYNIPLRFFFSGYCHKSRKTANVHHGLFPFCMFFSSLNSLQWFLFEFSAIFKWENKTRAHIYFTFILIPFPRAFHSCSFYCIAFPNENSSCSGLVSHIIHAALACFRRPVQRLKGHCFPHLPPPARKSSV